MKRQTEQEQFHRFLVKALDQVFYCTSAGGAGLFDVQTEVLTEPIKVV